MKNRINPFVAAVALAVAAAAVAAVAWRTLSGGPLGARGPGVVLAHGAPTPKSAPAPASGTGAAAGPTSAPDTGRDAARAPAPSGAVTDEARAALGDFERLRSMPAGDAAIELSRGIEDAYTAGKAQTYMQALLSTEHDEVERAAAGALTRQGDADAMRKLADRYGQSNELQRGRILQVLEQASNPQALEGLADIVAADTSERRSAITMSAMVGIANIGTMESVTYLLEQVGAGNHDFALEALQRVGSAQGVEIIRAAAEGSKDAASVPSAFRPALARIAAALAVR